MSDSNKTTMTATMAINALCRTIIDLGYFNPIREELRRVYVSLDHSTEHGSDVMAGYEVAMDFLARTKKNRDAARGTPSEGGGFGSPGDKS